MKSKGRQNNSGATLALTLVVSLALLAGCSGETQKPDLSGETLSVKSPAAADNPMRKFAQNAQGTFACGLYLNGKKVGYMVNSSKIVKRGDTDFFEQKVETMISAKKEGKPFVDKSMLTRMFNLDNNGELTSIDLVSERDGATYTSNVIKQGDKFQATSSGGKSTNTLTIGSPKTSLGNDKQLGEWLKASRKPGDTFDHASSDFRQGEFAEQVSHYKYVEQKKVVINGVETTVHKLDVKEEGDDEVTQYECDNFGRMLGGNIGPIAFRLEDESTARKLDAQGIDLVADSSVPTNVAMGDPKKLKQVLLKISGIKYTLPDSHRQMQIADGKKTGWTTIMINRDFKSQDKEPLSKEDQQKYLKATPTIQSDSKEIKEFAAKALGQSLEAARSMSGLKKAELLQSAVYKLISKDVNRNSTTALEVLERKAGDCTEHTLLFNALARAAGMPSREVSGLMYTQSPKPQYYWHAWNEVHDGERWISVDPTWNETLVDAGHLKITYENSMKIASSFGKLKIEIISFQTDDSIPTKGAFIGIPKSQSDEKELVLMDKVPPPPAALHENLKEAPPSANFGANASVPPAMRDENALNEAAKPKIKKRTDLGKPIEQFSGSKMQSIQFDKQGNVAQ